ncbi:hypothetical protein JCM11251_007677 [Rhodosporidiobolus azoricus]
MKIFLALLTFAASALAHSGSSDHDFSKRRLDVGKTGLAKRASCTIKSLADVSKAQTCTDILIESFTVPAGQTFELKLKDNTIVHLMGDLKFATGKNWEGPLMSVSGKNIDFRGNGHKLDGQGAWYWDGKGGNGGKTKPKFFKVKFSGKMTNVVLYNQPVHGFSVSNPAKLLMSGITVDCRDGKTGGGHNTDAFDVSASTDLTITNSKIYNQDDCIAINDAKNLVFSNNRCEGGHGISVGSIKDGKHVSGVTIKGNTIVDSDQALRIKTYVGAKDASVDSILYDGNTASGIAKYGVIIQQDYTNEGATGKATNGVPIKNVHITGKTTSISVDKKAKQVYVLCASGACSDFDFSSLSVTGGSKGSTSGVSVKNWKI